MSAINILSSTNGTNEAYGAHTTFASHPISKEIVDPGNWLVALKSFVTARFTELSIRNFGHIEPHKFVLGPLRLLVPIKAGINIYNIVSTIKSAGTLSAAEKIEAAVDVIVNVGSVGDCIEVFVGGLQGIRVIGHMAWGTPLLFASIGLEALSIPLEIKFIVDAHRFSKSLKKEAGLYKTIEEYTLEDYQHGLRLIEQKGMKRKSFISTYFPVKEDVLAERLLEIESEASVQLASSKPAEVLQGKEKLYSTMQTLRKRATTKKWANLLSIISTIIEIAGIVLAFTPLAPVGYCLIAIGSAIVLGNFIYKKRMERQFKKALGIGQGGTKHGNI